MTQVGKRSESLVYWYLALLPLIAVLAVVEFYPLLDGLNYSLTSANGGFSLANYSGMVTSLSFWLAVIVSLTYSVSSTGICFVIGVVLAYLVTQRVRGRGVFEAIYILPLAVSPIVVGVVWAPGGFWDDIQTFTHFILHIPYWNELSVLFYFPVMVVSEAWEWAPLVMLVSLSIIYSQPSSVFEAAEVHGASAWQRFRLVALPSIIRSPVMQFVIVLRLVDAMQSFAIPLAWSNWVGFTSSIGSPVDTLSLYLYKLIFLPIYGFPIGLVSAVGVSLLAVTLVVAFALLRILGRMGGK